MVVTKGMLELLKEISNLCDQASEVVFENEKTKEILNTCDNLVNKIDGYLNEKEG